MSQDHEGLTLVAPVCVQKSFAPACVAEHRLRDRRLQRGQVVADAAFGEEVGGAAGVVGELAAEALDHVAEAQGSPTRSGPQTRRSRKPWLSTRGARTANS